MSLAALQLRDALSALQTAQQTVLVAAANLPAAGLDPEQALRVRDSIDFAQLGCVGTAKLIDRALRDMGEGRIAIASGSDAAQLGRIVL